MEETTDTREHLNGPWPLCLPCVDVLKRLVSLLTPPSNSPGVEQILPRALPLV